MGLPNPIRASGPERATSRRRVKSDCQIKMVRMEGLEPPRLSAPEPKSGASTNFATSARVESRRYDDIFRTIQPGFLPGLKESPDRPHRRVDQQSDQRQSFSEQ